MASGFSGGGMYDSKCDPEETVIPKKRCTGPPIMYCTRLKCYCNIHMDPHISTVYSY